jgi:TDG/mug DNA glycosylase family protein
MGSIERLRIMLPDLLRENLTLVFCGTAVGNTSAQLQQYYARPGNKFWKVLFEVGLTPLQLAPSEYERLLDYGIGLTDLAKDNSGMDKRLKPANFGKDALIKKLETYQPKILCFNGKRAGVEFLGRPVQYGLQPENFAGASLFVATSTSGAANGSWDIKVWQELAELCK